MIRISSITIIFSPQSQTQFKQGSDCYLIISNYDDQYFTKATKLYDHRLHWELKEDIYSFIFYQKNSTLTLRLINYDNCRELFKYELTVGEQHLMNSNKTYEQDFINNGVQAKVSVILVEAQQQEQKIIEKTYNYDRFSKKTNTTHYQDSIVVPSIEKVSSLKLIVNSPREWYTVSPSQTPKGEYPNLRSLRANLDKKLFASIQFQPKAKKRFII